VIANLNCLAEEAAWVTPKIEYQALQIREAVDGLIDFLRSGFLELREVDVSDAGANLVFEVDGRMRDFVADEVETEGLGLSIAND
jgi:hypothetical protein